MLPRFPYPVSVSWTAVNGARTRSSWSCGPVLPLVVEDAHDGEPDAVEVHGPADGGQPVPAHEIGRDRDPEQGDPAMVGVVGVGERRAGLDAVVVVGQVARRAARERRDAVRGPVVGRGHRLGVHHRGDRLDVRCERRVGEGVGVVHREHGRPGARAAVDRGLPAGHGAVRGTDDHRTTTAASPAEEPAAPTCAALGGANGQGVAAELADRLLDGHARARPDRDEDDHGGDPDEDAERRQRRAHLVRGDAPTGEARALPQVHDEASTPAPRAAALRAGGGAETATRRSSAWM